MIDRKEKPFVCSRGCAANTSLAGPREGRERRAQHITKSHTVGNVLLADVLSGRHCKQLCISPGLISKKQS